jgi:hypothetical protein
MPQCSSTRPSLAVLLISVACASCGAPEPPAAQGVDVPVGPCGRGFVVVGTDYQSTNVWLVDHDGVIRTPSLVSSATSSAGISAPLSGDAILPTEPAFRDNIVLMDFHTSVLSWVDIRRGGFASQLSVGTGFKSNPRDYVELDPQTAYVTRYDPDSTPGSEPFDGGDDLLIIDPSVPAIVDRIALDAALLGVEPGLFARPRRALRVGDRVYVALGVFSKNFTTAGDGRLVVIDTTRHAISEVVELEGLHDCNGLAVSPDGGSLALVCSGAGWREADPSLEQAGVVVLSTADGIVERQRFAASELGTAPPAFSVDFATASTLVVTLVGSSDGTPPESDDALVEIDLQSGAHRVLLRSAAASLGEMRCASECGVCMAADTRHGGVLHRFEVDAEGHLGEPQSIANEPVIGLPPRFLGRF